ncbi:MCE family protein [Nocardioides rubriscoriae]|uniref:MCE family protein n=1 Tax=Nocardioides rubriscoriae TaxID=642762 RepID=UPI0011DFB25D|nr:MCE family protein [Nocardioides rubriscoriae]
MTGASTRNSTTVAAGIKLGVFTVVSLLVTGLLAVIMGNIGFGDSRTYRAEFVEASSLEKGDDVRVAGVSVGEVTAVEHYGDDNANALVTFRVEADVPLTTASLARVKFLNLVGDRYLALEEGVDKGASRLGDNGLITMDHTEPALDLTALFNGFKPLFQALRPEDVNELSMNIVQVLQGEGGTVASLLANTASLTNTLADRDQLIGEVVDNLGTTLETVDSRHVQLERLIVELRDWMGDLADDRQTIGRSLASISDLTAVVADLLQEGRPLLQGDIAELRTLSRLLNEPENKKLVVEIFDRLPESMTDQTRTGTYGSWYNYYICGFSGKITLPVISGLPIIKQLNQQLNSIDFRSTAPRCNP